MTSNPNTGNSYRENAVHEAVAKSPVICYIGSILRITPYTIRSAMLMYKIMFCQRAIFRVPSLM